MAQWKGVGRPNTCLMVKPVEQSVDSKMRFTLEPLPGDDAFRQWRDAMRSVARLPLGIPPEFRKKVWLTLANSHIVQNHIDWEKTKKFAFNDKSNPDDDSLGLQIVKDLHRTGCSNFSGQDNDEERAVLKRVLLAYARWNKKVGYCQGFNVLVALILDLVGRREDEALKIMIYLVDHVLPEGYFANSLQALSVDMAVFRDLLRHKHPDLSRHLDKLQRAADSSAGNCYEPPLTNVFTMQWFLTMFATCLPKATALRVWDAVILEGSEVLLRTAVAIWGKLKSRIMKFMSADEFYMMMGAVTQEMLDNKIISADELLKAVYDLAPFPLPQLNELREKYTFNITPFSAALNAANGKQRKFVNDEDVDEDALSDGIGCFAVIMPSPNGIISTKPKPMISDATTQSSVQGNADMSEVSPGAYAAHSDDDTADRGIQAVVERSSLDLDTLNKQYNRLKERQRQASIILAAANARHYNMRPNKQAKDQSGTIPTSDGIAINHLFIGRNESQNKNKMVSRAPPVVPLFPSIVENPAETTRYVSGKLPTKNSADLTFGIRQNSTDSSIRPRGSFSSTNSLDSVSVASGTTTFSDEESKTTKDSKTIGSYVNCENESNKSSSPSSPPPPAASQSVVEVNNNGQCDMSTAVPTSSCWDVSSSVVMTKTVLANQTSSPSDGVDEVVVNSFEMDQSSNAQRKSISDDSVFTNMNNITSNQKFNQISSPSLKQAFKSKSLKTPPALPSKIYNPFPSSHFSNRRSQLGAKFGLYVSSDSPVSSHSVNPMTPPLTKSVSLGQPTIGRSQINACLNRHYLAELRQNSARH